MSIIKSIFSDIFSDTLLSIFSGDTTISTGDGGVGGGGGTGGGDDVMEAPDPAPPTLVTFGNTTVRYGNTVALFGEDA